MIRGHVVLGEITRQIDGQYLGPLPQVHGPDIHGAFLLDL